MALAAPAQTRYGVTVWNPFGIGGTGDFWGEGGVVVVFMEESLEQWRHCHRSVHELNEPPESFRTSQFNSVVCLSPLPVDRPRPETMPPRTSRCDTPLPRFDKTHFIPAYTQDILHGSLALRAGAGVSNFGAMGIVVDHAVKNPQRNRRPAVVTRYIQGVKCRAVPRVMVRQFRGQ